MGNYEIQYKYEGMMEYKRWLIEIPFIQFPPDYQVKVCPPYGGAVVRFIIKKDKAFVSVYLDCYENLGYYGGKPYWEIYPHIDDVFRCDMLDIESLLAAISESIKDQLEK